MRHTKEFRGISTGNTIRCTKKYVKHHGKDVVCTGKECWPGLCMNAGVKWVYSSRKSSRAFREGFNGRPRGKCSFHGHRMCSSPEPDELTNYKKRQNNKKFVTLILNSLENENDDSILDDIPECIEYENEEFDTEVDKINYSEKEKTIDTIDIVQVEFENMKVDEWILLENEN